MKDQSSIIVLLVVALFITLFIALRVVIAGMLAHNHRAGRLHYKQKRGISGLLESQLMRQEKLYRHLSDLLESTRAPFQPLAFITLSFALAIISCIVGLLLFQSLKGTLLPTVIGGLMPYTIVRMTLLQSQLQTRIDFLPSVELFYQSYLVTGERHVRHALQRTIEERRLPARMQPVFDQLYRNLSVRGDDEASLRIFAGALGHVWGEYFVNLMRVSLSEGSTISESLRELLKDMRRSRRANEQERNKLLEIRIANFTPILFLILFVGLNVHYSPENAYHYYLVDPKGRDLMLNAIVLIFASFLMGIWLSRRKM
ncbi:Flp pilus assembly protein TadB [Paenibacillus cellulosilyticus]|uniref:Flp pilus assembly protein TadB n=1 Tax=Paenibacillus cellulosilyticus TaxID=375489 RepID=A0A2V2YQX3_9BACL|nr:type II secretion system F family protein [Paenibacillus cellulosilyticus]PWV95586.1 Flp pilus assembly protein TadB [Paenibacillus cellulosilyticus]QKS47343.1 type II secretion system F family protein [Paenibacillus cellulosilyticus]